MYIASAAADNGWTEKNKYNNKKRTNWDTIDE
jgi:hypothetical protein